jgi:hypothetical protein
MTSRQKPATHDDCEHARLVALVRQKGSGVGVRTADRFPALPTSGMLNGGVASITTLPSDGATVGDEGMLGIEAFLGAAMVQDRHGLEAASCECHSIIRAHFDRLRQGDSRVVDGRTVIHQTDSGVSPPVLWAFVFHGADIRTRRASMATAVLRPDALTVRSAVVRLDETRSMEARSRVRVYSS